MFPENNELPELVLGSKSQSEEEVQKVLEDLGYESVGVETQSDEPAASTEETAEETPAQPTDSSVPSTEAGSDAGADEDETAADSETAETQDPPAGKTKGGGFKKKISKLEKQISDLQRQLEEKTSVRPPVEDPIPDAVSAEATPEPQLDDVDADGNPKYADYEAYNKALTRWTVQDLKRQDAVDAHTARETKDKEAAAKQAEADQQAAVERWNEQLEVGKSKHDDFEAILEKSKTLTAAVPLTEAIQDSDFSAELVYHLATNPEELDRLNGLLNLAPNAPPSEFRRKLRIAHREIDRLETLISSGDIDTSATNGSEEETPERTAAPSREEAEPVAPKATPVTAAPVIKKKPEPIRPIGNRGGTHRKRLQDMTSAEIHALDPDELRKLVETAA